MLRVRNGVKYDGGGEPSKRDAGKGDASHVKDMTQGNPYSLMLGFALPIFLSQVFQQLYNTADALIVGKFLGTNALAAVTSSGTLIFLMISFFMGTAMGGGVVISKFFGAGDKEQISRAVHTILAFGIASGVVLTVTGVAFTPAFLRWMQTDAEVMPDAVEYFRYYFLGALAMVLYNICRSIMNALGDSRRPLYYLIFSSVLNIVLDLLFIGAFHWGVWSAAAATVISQAASVVLCMMHLVQKGNIYTVEWKKIRFHKATLVEIVRYGFPSGVQNSVIAFANVIVQSQINSFGKLAMAAYGTHAKIEGFAFLPITSFNMAATTFISQNLGARQYERAKKGARFSILAFDGMHLPQASVREVLEEFSTERVKLVLACTVKHKEWDLRFSPRNREWAKMIDTSCIGKEPYYCMSRSHPAILDGFISMFREQVLGKEKGSQNHEKPIKHARKRGDDIEL